MEREGDKVTIIAAAETEFETVASEYAEFEARKEEKKASLIPRLGSICTGILLALLAITAALSIALSWTLVFKIRNTPGGSRPDNSTFYGGSSELFFAISTNSAMVGLALCTFLFVVLPSCLCCLPSLCDESAGVKCAKYTFYAAAATTGCLALIGTFIAGILHVFAFTNYENIAKNDSLAAYGKATASMNLLAAVFGFLVALIAITTCWKQLGREETACYYKGCTCGCVLLVLPLVSAVVAALLTIFFSLFVTNFSDETGNGKTYMLASAAAVVSGLAAGTFCCSLCACPIMCLSEPKEKFKAELSLSLKVAAAVFVSISAGQLIAGSILMAAATRLSSEDLDMDQDYQLVRPSIVAMARLIGALNFLVVAITAVSFCATCLCCWKAKEE